MMIYFNNVLIDNDAVAGLTNDYKIYVDNFYLGGVASNTFKLTCGKQFINNHPSEIIINDGTTSFHLQVDKITEDKSFYYYDLVDAMVNFDFQYDAKPLIDSNKNNEIDTHLSDILQDICLQANIECQYVLTTTDYVVNWWDNRITARDYISMIAEKEGCFARISDNGELDFIPVNSPSKMTISEEYVSELFIGERKEITRVVYDNGVNKWEFGVDTGNTLYLNPNNVYILDASDVEQIYNKINGFTFYSITVSDAPIDSAIRAGDIITFKDINDNLYPTIAQYSTSYGGGWMGGYSFDIKTDKQQETNVIGLFDSIKSISTTIDRTNASLEIVSQQTDENSSQLAELELTVDGLQVRTDKIGGINLIKNSVGIFGDDGWINTSQLKDDGYDQSLLGKTYSNSKVTIKNGSRRSEQSNITDLIVGERYILSFKLINDENTTFSVILSGANEVIVNDTVTESVYLEHYSYSFVATSSDVVIELISSSLYDGKTQVTDLMLNVGDEKVWELAKGESVSSIVQHSGFGSIFKGYNTDTAVLIGASGLDIRELNNDQIGDRITYFDKDGTKTNKLECVEIERRNLIEKTIIANNKEVFISYIKG